MYKELKCKECGLVTGYVRGGVAVVEGDFLCLVCAYNDRDLCKWAEAMIWVKED